MLSQEFTQRFSESKEAFLRKEFHKARDILRSVEVDIEDSLTVKQYGKVFPKGEHCRASIIILSYRDDNLISEALSRVASQLEDHFEVILVSNGNSRLEARGGAMFNDFKFLELPLNVGCCMGRNIAAKHAKGKWLIFLEDDGLIESGCINALLGCAEDRGAVAVRGKVCSRTVNSKYDPPHYDLGGYRKFSFTTCEGISCIRREDFLTFNGFDPVLVGHEGVELCARMWRFYGPRGFVYEPNAVMLHDYSASQADVSAKMQRQAAFKEYVDVVTPNAMHLHSATMSTGRLTEATAAVSSLNTLF